MTREQRRLAAVVSADVAGYSRLMGRDDSDTLARLNARRRDLIDPQQSMNWNGILVTFDREQVEENLRAKFEKMNDVVIDHQAIHFRGKPVFFGPALFELHWVGLLVRFDIVPPTPERGIEN